MFTERRELNDDEVAEFLKINADSKSPQYEIGEFETSISESGYKESIQKIKQYLIEGDTYQVNYSFKCRFTFKGNPFSLYQWLREQQPCEYGAFIRTPDHEILSFSPELFVRKNGIEVTCKPMKGTRARGVTEDSDSQLKNELHADPKSIAENVIVVDLLRNDLGRIADIGSVRVDELFVVEPYRTLFQMTSTIKAKVHTRRNPTDFIRQLFPCGSITGAPKIRTIEIINELEPENRGIYTGSIGYFSPENDFCLNVAIRTLVIWPDGHGEMGIGSGIVMDSDADEEFAECLLKAEFLTGKDQLKSPR